ncbi:hypothetical protein [Xanthocytophaga agilis]|uniref:Uncharacterized protein n=1 Tax=Xanthocytophaga agilis TaxID=3048010 RepID=A0AAE3R8N1_9BACT|nr:hypothetical protein [Xanthocytophaga agilis]MDJ1503607.1 hypothetical protein [Xanthocytophaga agilis]
MQILASKNITALALIVFSWLYSFGQVKEIPNISLPQDFKEKYPFITDRFIEIISPEKDGSLGYCVMILDKQKLLNYYKTNFRARLEEMLRKYKFYNDDCYFNPTCSGTTVLKIQDYRLEEKWHSVNLGTRFEKISLFFDYMLWGRFKAWSRNTRFGIDFWNTRVCEEGPIIKSPENKLLYTMISAEIKFQPKDASSFLMVMNLNLFGQTLCQLCNKPGSPYTSITSRSEPYSVTSEVGFSGISEILALFEFTKIIKLTEDESFYYLYCIKKN